MSFKRFAPSAVLAVGVTVAITLGMGAMIKTEFSPQDKSEDLAFEINPQVVEPPVITRANRVLEVKRVETPPPPPIIERTPTRQPTTSIVDLDSPIPDFNFPKIEQDDFVIVVSDKNADPLVRIAPIMPPRADRSGYCKVRFDVSAEGAPYNVTATYCTQSLFERATIKSVQKWKYSPKILNGLPVAMTGLENRVTYRLEDERGNIIPE